MKQIKRHFQFAALTTGWLLIPALASAISMSISPSGTALKLQSGATQSWTATATAPGCQTPPTYNLIKRPTHGLLALHADFASNGQYSFTNSDQGQGRLGAVKEELVIGATCAAESVSVTIELSDATSSCSGSILGSVIFNNTATPESSSIKTNLALLAGCAKSSTTIATGLGGNAINKENFHVLTRDTSTEPHKLMLKIGAEASEVQEKMYGSEQQLSYFADGNHLFELNRLRDTADWLSGTDANGTANITPDNDVATNAYGTMTMKQLIQHIAAGHTLYGMVRVKVGLQKGQRGACTANCTLNTLRQTVAANSLYGFCANNTNAGLCTTTTSCAPGKDFNNLGAGTSICGISLPASAKLQVKGSLMFDFVDYLSGQPITLAELPFAPRELYFMVRLPVMINWSNDANNDGAMDGMLKINSVTANLTSRGFINNSGINFSDISQEAKDAYAFQVGKPLTTSDFNALSEADKYHLLMPSGYAGAWGEVFDKLNIDAATWKSLPPTGCIDSSNSACEKFGVPDEASGIITLNNVRSSRFEDIPSYLYSGGLIDMHSHVNVSGLMYVPQAMEMEALDNNLSGQTITIHQYVSGAIVVRDGFYIQANNSARSITVISADPSSYSTAKTISSTSNSGFIAEISGPGTPPSSDTDTTNSGNNVSDSSPCIGCQGAGNNGGNSSGGSPGSRIWMEVRPE